MLNPLQNPAEELKKRVISHMEKALIPEQIGTLVRNVFTEFLQHESIILTRNEKRRLYQMVLKGMFDDILAKPYE